jgi:hypothetical protein
MQCTSQASHLPLLQHPLPPDRSGNGGLGRHPHSSPRQVAAPLLPQHSPRLPHLLHSTSCHRRVRAMLPQQRRLLLGLQSSALSLITPNKLIDSSGYVFLDKNVLGAGGRHTKSNSAHTKSNSAASPRSLVPQLITARMTDASELTRCPDPFNVRRWAVRAECSAQWQQQF